MAKNDTLKMLQSLKQSGFKDEAIMGMLLQSYKTGNISKKEAEEIAEALGYDFNKLLK